MRISIQQLIIAVSVSICEYALIPILLALFRKKGITKGKYRTTCFLINIAILFLDSIAGSALYGKLTIRVWPFLLYSTIGVWIGTAILKSKRVVKDESSRAQGSANTVAEISSIVEKRYICRNCGKLSTGWYQTCPNCGAVGRMETASPSERSIDKPSQDSDKAETILANGGWRCPQCGKVHFAYESSCSCGASRFDIRNESYSKPLADTAQNAPPEESANLPGIVPQVEVADSREPICDNCGAILPEGAKFCAVCGQAVVMLPVMKYCRFCGSKLEERSKFCPQCGKQLV